MQIDNPSHNFPKGCHVAEVEIDPDTGRVALLRYTSVDDFGNILEPALVAGQVHGGGTQGVGQALCEHAIYDGDGQLLTGSLMDYALPRAGQLPTFAPQFEGTPCRTNPLGVKGAGESAFVLRHLAQVLNMIAMGAATATSAGVAALCGWRAHSVADWLGATLRN